MYVTDFEYANRRLSEFGCIVCHINSDASMQEKDIGCDITFTTVKNNHTSINSATSTSYDNVYTTTFEIMKNPCKTSDDEMFLSPEEVRALVKWLNRREYHKFKLYNPDYEMPEIYYYGSFNVKQIWLGNKILGLSLTFTANAPYGLGEQIRFESYVLESNGTFSVFGDSDEIGTIYPNIKIECYADTGKGEEGFRITNKTTGNYTYIDNCKNGEIIYMDGNHKIIVTDREEHKETLYNDFNYEFLDIEVDASDWCENEYEVSHPCKITISYSPIRKVGVN